MVSLLQLSLSSEGSWLDGPMRVRSTHPVGCCIVCCNEEVYIECGEKEERVRKGGEKERKKTGGDKERERGEGAGGGNVPPMGRCFIMVVGVDL